ncbi:MAG: hypothetical protein KDD69_02910 [Bdellovibrionales bacterium]|nr:hypothetical protein [Bdellovibrionales bacterium]
MTSAANWTDEDIKKAVDAICDRASTDASFHALAIKDPAKAVETVTNKQVPAGYTIRFVSNENAYLTVVLPDTRPEGELSDSDLESVAGGRCKITNVSIGYCR